MEIKVSHSRLLSLLHNPLLLTGGINTVLATNRGSEHDIFEEEYKKALQQTATKDLVFGLEAGDSEQDLGFGGFYGSGAVLPFFSPFQEPRQDWKKDFAFYWPRDPYSNKYMRFIGAINLGLWPLVFHQFTRFKGEWCKDLSFVGGYLHKDCDYMTGSASFYNKVETWMYLFVSSEHDFESPTADSHVRLVNHHWSEHRKKREFTDAQVMDFVKEWNETETTKTEINTPSTFFTKPVPCFYYDGLKYSADKQADSDKGIFKWGGNPYRIFGKFDTQQEPKRYLSPNNYLVPHALTPMFSFTDEHHDMTHQFTADGLLMDDIRHKQYYCKLDSSCT